MAMAAVRESSGDGGLLSALAGNAKPDHVIGRNQALDLMKAEGAVKTHGAFIGRSDAEVRLGRADRRHAFEPGADQNAADAPALQSRQEIDVQVRRIRLA